MADKAISELIAADQVTPTDLFVLEQSGTAKKLTGQILENWLVSFADGHGGIQSIVKHSTDVLVDTYRITLADTTTFDFVVNNGRGINTIEKTGTSGLVDTYTITFNDATSSTFEVVNGAKGDKGDNTYTHIKYASRKPTASSHSMGDVADNWIGIYFGASETAPTDWQQYEWFQIKGEKGDPGVPATLVSSVTDYQTSDSGTVIPSGAWLSSVPVVAQGKYLWTRTTNTFNTGAPAVSYSVSRMGIDGSGSVSSVANISPDVDGNIPLTASDVGALPSNGGDLTGELRMNGQKLRGLNAPTENDEAATKGYVDNVKPDMTGYATETYVNSAVKKAAPRNLLDNSYWENPSDIVNQRGQTSYTGSGYTIDRWYSHPNNKNVTINSNGITVEANTGTLGWFTQKLEASNFLGKTCTAAIKLAKGEVVLCTGTFPSSYATSEQVIARTDTDEINVNLFWYADETAALRLRINGTTVTIAWAALYEGVYTAETLPEYQPKGYGVELAECQRYYQKYDRYDTVGYVTTSSTDYVMEINLPVAMRIRPSVSTFNYVGRLYNGGYSKYTTSAGKDTTAISVYSGNAKDTGAFVICDSIDASAGDTNNSIILYTITGLMMSADL